MNLSLLALVFALAAFDLGATYSAVKRAGPGGELNGLARWAWRRFGLRMGTVLLASVAFGILTSIAMLMPEEILWYMLGAYSVVAIIHLHLLAGLRGTQVPP